MTDLLPIDTYVRVTPSPVEERRPYAGIVRGYDIHRSKYQIGAEYLPGLFMDGGSWAFPSQVEAIEGGAADA